MMLVLGMAILMSGTRSAWIAVIVSLVIILLPRMNVKKFLLLLAGLAVLGAAAGQVPNLFEFVNSRASNAVSSGGAGRTNIWQVGLTNFTEHPLLGVGVGNFPKTFDYDLIQKTLLNNGGAQDSAEGRASHNIYLGTLVETGIVGLFLLLAIFRRTLRAARTAYEEGHLVNAIVVSYMVQGFFLDMLKRKYLWLAIALSLGLQFAAESARKSKEEENRRDEPERTLADAGLSQPGGADQRHFS
jgi:O-antigen ligase